MKQIILSLTIVIIAVTSVFADNDKPITVEQLPANARQFIEKYFSETKVSSVKMETDIFDKSYEVVFTNGNKIEFDGTGEWEDVDCKFTQVPESIVPQKIKDYVVANYKDTKILKIDRDKRKYEVKLSNKLELEFDSEFNLSKIDD